MIQMCENTGNEVRVLMNEMHQWGVIDPNGVIIVPFGRYDWIDNFDQGLARVNIRIPQGGNRYATAKKWGIINERGEEVLPLEYDEIWNFYGKNRYSTKAVLDGEEYNIYFHDLNPELPVRGIRRTYTRHHNYRIPRDPLCFDTADCYDEEGYFDYDRLEGAVMDGEYVPEYWFG